MKQEPIAWWMKANDPDFDKDYLTFDKPTRNQKVSHQDIELYTAPKDLSDEEIEEVEKQVDKEYEENLIYRQNEWVYLFARAILKKASEK